MRRTSSIEIMRHKIHELCGFIPTLRSALSRGSTNWRGEAPFQRKNVIAFSLWGKSPRYWIGALRNIELAQTFYPGWFCRFYVDRKVPSALLISLRGDNVEVFLRRRWHDFDGAFWRFSAASDPSVNIALFRDCDSRIGRREATAVNAWIQSGKDFHIMRDHPQHAAQILAGMWGCRAGALPNIDKLMARWSLAHWKSLDYKGSDQKFLAERVYPLIAQRAVEHSEFDLAYANPTSLFPTERQDFEFVGEIFDECDRRNEDGHRAIVEALQLQRR